MGNKVSVRPGVVWVQDKEAKTCRECAKAFTWIRRRHHCRFCGNIYCSKCCNKQKVATNQFGKLRVCSTCKASKQLTVWLKLEAFYSTYLARELSLTVLENMERVLDEYSANLDAAVDLIETKVERCEVLFPLYRELECHDDPYIPEVVAFVDAGMSEEEFQAFASQVRAKIRVRDHYVTYRPEMLDDDEFLDEMVEGYDDYQTLFEQLDLKMERWRTIAPLHRELEDIDSDDEDSDTEFDCLNAIGRMVDDCTTERAFLALVERLERQVGRKRAWDRLWKYKQMFPKGDSDDTWQPFASALLDSCNRDYDKLFAYLEPLWSNWKAALDAGRGMLEVAAPYRQALLDATKKSAVLRTIHEVAEAAFDAFVQQSIAEEHRIRTESHTAQDKADDLQERRRSLERECDHARSDYRSLKLSHKQDESQLTQVSMGAGQTYMGYERERKNMLKYEDEWDSDDYEEYNRLVSRQEEISEGMNTIIAKRAEQVKRETAEHKKRIEEYETAIDAVQTKIDKYQKQALALQREADAILKSVTRERSAMEAQRQRRMLDISRQERVEAEQASAHLPRMISEVLQGLRKVLDSGIKGERSRKKRHGELIDYLEQIQIHNNQRAESQTERHGELVDYLDHIHNNQRAEYE